MSPPFVPTRANAARARLPGIHSPSKKIKADVRAIPARVTGSGRRYLKEKDANVAHGIGLLAKRELC